MELFHSRYELERPWTPAADGWLATAHDTKLNRSVLLWRVAVQSPQEKEEFLRRLGNAARFSHRQFVHILDVSVTESGVYAVLTQDKGMRLSEQLRRFDWSKEELLGKLRELVPAIREARRERLQDFPVTADNLWVDGTGKLRIINYWSEGEKERRDVCGLAMLLYQLCSRQEVLPASIKEYNRVIAETLADLPGGSGEDAAEWASSAFLPSCSLREYEAGLSRLLDPVNRQGRPVAPIAQQPEAPSRMRSRQQESPAPAQPQRVAPPVQLHLPDEDEEEDRPRGFNWRPWIYFSLGLVIVGFVAVIGLWLIIRSPGDAEEKPVAGATATVAVDTKSTLSPSTQNTPKPSTSSTANASVKPSGSPPAKSSTAPGQNNGGAQAPATTANVPDLVNHTLEEASQMALKAGLRYEYVLEPHSTAKGLVFKQDLTPGSPVAKGDTITFWVSKGQ